MSWLINAAQVDKFRKSQKSLILLDASWHMPSSQRDAKAEFLDKHIIDAKFFDIMDFCDNSSEAPHPLMLLRDEKRLGEKLGALGIRNDYKIIFYDNSDLHTACRALWMFQMFGHNTQQLYILDGGLNAWLEYNGKTESGEAVPSPKSYDVKLQEKYIRTLSQMKNNLHHNKEQIIDVRHAVRYAGGPELKEGIRPGHIPGSYSFPYTSFFEKSGYFRPIEKIRMQLTGVGIDVNAPTVSMCGSGMTAPIVNFVFEQLGNMNHAVYNGSWNEWGAEKLYPNELSLDERPVVRSIDLIPGHAS